MTAGNYKHKGVDVLAFQFLGFKEQTEFPQWITDALKAGEISLDVISGTIYHDCGPLRINKDDWIVQGQDGEMWPVSNEHFGSLYEATPATSPVGGLPVSGSPEPVGEKLP